MKMNKFLHKIGHIAVMIISLTGFALPIKTYGVSSSNIHKIDLNWKEIENIHLKILDAVSVGVSALIYDRETFDEVFEQLRYDKYTARLDHEISDPETIMYFVTLMNTLEPLDEDRIEIYPDEVNAYKSPPGAQKWYNLRDEGTNDPIETRGKIIFTYKDGHSVEAFWSPTLLDIFNYRYVAKPVSTVIFAYVLYLTK